MVNSGNLSASLPPAIAFWFMIWNQQAL